MADIIKGAPIANQIREELIAEVEAIKARGIEPKLSVVLVGDDPGSVWYAKSKIKVGEKVNAIKWRFVSQRNGEAKP